MLCLITRRSLRPSAQQTSLAARFPASVFCNRKLGTFREMASNSDAPMSDSSGRMRGGQDQQTVDGHPPAPQTLSNLLQDALETPLTRSSSIDWSSASETEPDRPSSKNPEIPPYVTPLPQAHLQTLPHSHLHTHPRASSGLVPVGGDIARAPLLLSRIPGNSTPIAKISGEAIPVASVGLGETRLTSIERQGRPEPAPTTNTLEDTLKAVHGRPVRLQGHEQDLLSGLSQRIRQSPEKRSRVRSSTEQDARPAASTLEAAGKKASGILNQVNMAGKQFSAFMPESLRKDDQGVKAQKDLVNRRPPMLRHRSSSTSSLSPPPRHLQRTISSLLEIERIEAENYVNSSPQERHELVRSTSIKRSSSFTSLQFPLHLGLSRPNLPSLPNVQLPRPFSSTPTINDTAGKPLWRTLWEGTGVADENKKDPKAKKKAHDVMLSEEDKGADVEESMAKIERKYATPKNPLVFCHGLLGFDYLGPASLPPLQISHWRGIREVLEANGCEVMITRVPATSSTKVRSEILMAAIEEKYPGREVNLIGHSMGGIDGRYMISKLKPDKFKVCSLSTISTPHRGSPFADYVIDNIIGRDNLPSWLSLLDSLKLPNGGDGMAFEALGSKSMESFNDECPDDPDVRYFSWGASFEPGYLDTFRWSHSVIYAAEGPNDGLVSVKSAQHGEYQGTLEGVSHTDLVGWTNNIRLYLNAVKFKPATFYLEVSDLLAKKGF